jgi:uncharacterized hydrophobic protein (TIGR00271 family)
MVHLRIVAPPDKAERALDLLCGTPSVCNVILLPGAARRPEGDVILCDVAREDASVVLQDLKGLDIQKEGSIALEVVDMEISEQAEAAERYATGSPSDAVVWEEVEQRTSESVELSAVFLAFMVLAALLSAVGILLDSPVLIVGAMVVGPEFGPIAGFCVALVQRRRALAVRSLVALSVGFPLAIVAVYLMVLIFTATGLSPEAFSSEDHALATVISSPDFFAFFVAVCAGAAGMLSLTTAKSGALIGVLISVTTLPAAANIGVAAAYRDWDSCLGSVGQLAINLSAILLAGTTTLVIQRLLYARRAARHREELERTASALPIGQARRAFIGAEPVRAKRAAQERERLGDD